MTFKNLRQSKNVKQKNIMYELNISSGCVSQYETGIRTPAIEMLPKLAEILNCSIEELVWAIIETKEQAQQKALHKKV